MRIEASASRTASASGVRGRTSRDWSANANKAISLAGGRCWSTPSVRPRMSSRSLGARLPEASTTTASNTGRAGCSGPAPARLEASPTTTATTSTRTRLIRATRYQSNTNVCRGCPWESVAGKLQCRPEGPRAHRHEVERLTRGWRMRVTGRTHARPPFRNNARLVLAATLGALALLVAVEVLLRKSRDFSPDFLASVLLYGLTVLNITLLLVLLFVLGRNLVRVLMEQRRGVLGARFRMRLLLVFLVMAVTPSLLLIVVGSDLIQQTVDRWFNVDVERILSSSQALSTALRESVAERARVNARLLGRELSRRRLLEPALQSGLRRTVEARAREWRLDMVNVYAKGGELVAVVDPRLPPAHDDRASGEALAESAAGGNEVEARVPFGPGELTRVAVPVRDAAGQSVGAVIVSGFLSGELAGEAHEVQERYLKFRKAHAARRPILAFYLSLYLLPALLILFGAVWLALYLARRITTPLRLVAEGAERI